MDLARDVFDVRTVNIGTGFRVLVLGCMGYSELICHLLHCAISNAKIMATNLFLIPTGDGWVTSGSKGLYAQIAQLNLKTRPAKPFVI